MGDTEKFLKGLPTFILAVLLTAGVLWSILPDPIPVVDELVMFPVLVNIAEILISRM